MEREHALVLLIILLLPTLVNQETPPCDGVSMCPLARFARKARLDSARQARRADR